MGFKIGDVVKFKTGSGSGNTFIGRITDNTQAPLYYVEYVNNAGMTTGAVLRDDEITLVHAKKSGHATLSSAGKIPCSQIPTTQIPIMSTSTTFEVGDRITYLDKFHVLWRGEVVETFKDTDLYKIDCTDSSGYATASYTVAGKNLNLDTNTYTKTETKLNPIACVHRWEKILLFTSTVEHCKHCGISKLEHDNLEIRKKEEKDKT